MKEERIKRLKSELRYLLPSEASREIERYMPSIEDEKISIKIIAREIYKQRGIDYNKLNKGLINNISNTVNEFIETFRGRDKKIRNRMIVEIVYMLLIVILLKIPFDLVNDIGYDYIDLLIQNSLYSTLWNLAFLVLYTITAICTLIILIRNFNSKYKK